MCANLAVGRGAICRSYGAWLASGTLVAINMALLRSLAGVVQFVTDGFNHTRSCPPAIGLMLLAERKFAFVEFEPLAGRISNVLVLSAQGEFARFFCWAAG